MDNASPSLADIAAVCKDENGFGGSWLWIIVLFPVHVGQRRLGQP